jgi:hypothetical protein
VLPDLATDSGPALHAVTPYISSHSSTSSLDEGVRSSVRQKQWRLTGTCPQMIGLPPVTAIVAPEM